MSFLGRGKQRNIERLSKGEDLTNIEGGLTRFNEKSRLDVNTILSISSL